MKKLFILLAAVALTAMSANVFAQGTGTAPSIGSTHQYWVNGTFDTPSSGENSTYTWWISTNPSDLLVRTSLNTDFTVTSNGVDYDTPTVGGRGIEITWNPSASTENYYYLVVQEDGVDPLCANIKAIPILPTNNFELIFAAIAEDQTSLGDSLERCAPDIALSAAGVEITYDYGADTMMFKVTALDLYTNWSFAYTFANTLGTVETSTIEYQVGGTDAGSWEEIPVTPVSISANTAGTEDVYIRVVVDNGTSAGDNEDGVDGQEVKLTLSSVQDAGSNAVTTIYTSDGTTPFESAETATQTQTVKARPNTSGIQTDL